MRRGAYKALRYYRLAKQKLPLTYCQAHLGASRKCVAARTYLIYRLAICQAQKLDTRYFGGSLPPFGYVALLLRGQAQGAVVLAGTTKRSWQVAPVFSHLLSMRPYIES